MAKKNDSKGYAFITTFFSIIGFLIALLAWRKDKYVMHYAKQSLVIFIVSVVGGIIGGIFSWLPVLGSIISTAISLLVTVLWIFSWIYALSGEIKEVPLIGPYAQKISL
ncbi:DUF4870 domain-containing protein [archaeon]|nr:DUF4870 domain-containing protein [archaeon]